MAIAHVGNIGTNTNITNNQANITVTLTAGASAGDLVVVLVAVDNNQTASGSSSAVSGVSDNSGGGNTWTKAVGWCYSSGSTNSGADCSLWYSKLAGALSTSNIITATFTTATTSDCQAITVHRFTGAGLAIEGTATGSATAAADPPSLNITTANIQCLRIRGIASESSATTALTVTSSWTALTQAVADKGTTTTSQAIRGEFRISTGTGDASDPTLFSADHASVYAAFKETARTLTADAGSYNYVGRATDNLVLLVHCDGADASTTFTDSVGRHTVTRNGSAEVDTAQSKFGGASAKFVGPSAYLSSDGSSDFSFGTGDFTIDLWVRFNTQTGTHVLYDSRTGSGAPSRAPLIATVNTNTWIFHDAAGIVIDSGAIGINTAQWYHVAVARASGSTRMFIDGTQRGSTYADSNNYGIASVSPTIGGYGGEGTDGWIDEVRVHKGTALWVQNFAVPTAADSPFGLVYNRRLTSAAGSYSYTAGAVVTLKKGRPFTGAAGGYTYTGTVALLKRSRIMPALAGSYTYTGTAASLYYGRKVAANAGSYNLTGTAASLYYGRKVAADAGSYTYTGTAAAFFYTRAMSAGAGSYVYTGSDVNLTYEQVNEYILPADVGSYALTGTSASLNYGRRFVADAGSYTYTGTAAALRRGYAVAAGGGSYTYTGTAAALNYARKIVANAGSYSLTGTAASLYRGRKVAANAGAYSYTGTAAAVRYTRIMSAAAGTYSYTGTDANLTYEQVGEYILQVDPGAYALTGTAALLKVGRQPLTADAGSYLLTGTDADLIYVVITHYGLAADSGSYSITGGDADLQYSGEAVPEAPPGAGGVWVVHTFTRKKWRQYKARERELEKKRRELERALKNKQEQKARLEAKVARLEERGEQDEAAIAAAYAVQILPIVIEFRVQIIAIDAELERLRQQIAAMQQEQEEEEIALLLFS